MAPSTLPPPLTPDDIFPKREAPAEGAPMPEKVKFSFYLPYSAQAKGEEVDMVLVPSVTGDFGVMPGHVPTIAQLRPGVVSVHKEMDKDVQRFFVSSGFAFVHADSSADVCAVEAVPVDDLCPDTVAKGLAEANSKLASAQGGGDALATAEAQVGVEVYSAMSAALA